MTSLPKLSDIRALEEALHRPEVRRSREALEALLADGFVEFGASGRIYQRAETIDLLTQETGADPGDLTSSQYALTVISDNAVLLTYETERAQPDGSRRRVLRSSIWTQDGESWRMLFHQGTVRPG